MVALYAAGGRTRVALYLNYERSGGEAGSTWDGRHL